MILEDKKVVVIGGSSGIGLGIAKASVDEGAATVIASRSSQKLEAARILAEDGSRLKSEFLATISHELRTPLTVIRGYLETFIDNADDAPPMWRKALGQMEQQTDRMTLLIQDLLTLTKLETEDSEKNQGEIDVLDLLNMIRNDAIALSGDKKQVITIECDQPFKLLGNRQELQSAFSNLVFNAVKYSPANAKITINAYKKNDYAYITVEDNGPGIDSKHIPRLTERFYRVDSSRSQDTGGTGLGLAIVKHVLLRHNGQLMITSKLHKGSCFTCEFPPQRLLQKHNGLPKAARD